MNINTNTHRFWDLLHDFGKDLVQLSSTINAVSQSRIEDINKKGRLLISEVNQGVDLSVRSSEGELPIEYLIQLPALLGRHGVDETAKKLMACVLAKIDNPLLGYTLNKDPGTFLSYEMIFFILNQERKGNAIRDEQGNNLLHLSAQRDFHLFDDVCGNSFWKDNQEMNRYVQQVNHLGDLPIQTVWKTLFQDVTGSLEDRYGDRLYKAMYILMINHNRWGIPLDYPDQNGQELRDLVIQTIESIPKEMVEDSFENTWVEVFYQEKIETYKTALKEKKEIQDQTGSVNRSSPKGRL